MDRKRFDAKCQTSTYGGYLMDQLHSDQKVASS